MHPVFPSQATLESGTEPFKGLNQLDTELLYHRTIGRPSSILNATAWSQVLATETNLAISIYFYAGPFRGFSTRVWQNHA